MVWNQRNPQRGHLERLHNLFRNYCGRTVPTGNCRPGCGRSGDVQHRRGYRVNLHHYLAIGLLSVTNPAFANDDPTVNNNSNPVAAATGNVVNQNVNMQNSGAPSRQFFNANNSCNGATAQITPFYMGNDTIPYESEGYVRTNNYGMQISFSVPLDGSMVELCKQVARRHEQKLRLDQALVRALKCAELQTKGFTFRPGSQYEILCNDIVPIVAVSGLPTVQIPETN